MDLTQLMTFKCVYKILVVNRYWNLWSVVAARIPPTLTLACHRIFNSVNFWSRHVHNCHSAITFHFNAVVSTACLCYRARAHKNTISDVMTESTILSARHGKRQAKGNAYSPKCDTIKWSFSFLNCIAHPNPNWAVGELNWRTAAICWLALCFN